MSVYDTRDRGLLSESTHGKRERNNAFAISASTVRQWDKQRAQGRQRRNSAVAPVASATVKLRARTLRSPSQIARTISSRRPAA